MTDQLQQEQQAPLSAMEYIATSDGASLSLMGPLAQAYAEGLDALYAKERTDTGMAMETQAMDVGMARRLAKANMPALTPEDKAAAGMLYGVQKNAVTVQDSISIVDALTDMPAEQLAQSAVILDATGVPQEQLDNPIAMLGAVALERYCCTRGLRVYGSFAEFIEQRL